MQDFIYNKLQYYANQILNSNDENTTMKYFEESNNIYRELQSRKTLEAHLYCAVNLSRLSKY